MWYFFHQVLLAYLGGQVNIGEITMPPKMTMRGRPKGANVTVIGLPRKNKNFQKLQPFCKMHMTSKKKKILSWITDEEKVSLVFRLGTKLQNTDIHPFQKIDIAILDELVDVKIIRPYLDQLAFELLEKHIKEKRKKDEWKCLVCEHTLDGHSIGCDHCLAWYHLECVDLIQKPKCAYWYCKSCKNELNSGKYFSL